MVGGNKSGHKNGHKNGQEVLVVHLELFETDVDINPFCYEKTLEEIRRNFFDNEAVGMKQIFKRIFNFL